MKNIVIVGAGGFAREVAWLISEINEQKNTWNLLGFIYESPNNVGELLNKYPILGDFDWLEGKDELYFVCAVGNSALRKRLVEKALEYNSKIEAAILIHPSVRVSKYNSIGKGTIISAGNIITVNTNIGEHVVIYLDCTICHDAVLGNYATILPSTNISGNVTVGDLCEIGAGTTVIQKVTIGNNAIVGAGAVVISDIPSNCTSVGVPARVIKFNNK